MNEKAQTSANEVILHRLEFRILMPGPLRRSALGYTKLTVPYARASNSGKALNAVIAGIRHANLPVSPDDYPYGCRQGGELLKSPPCPHGLPGVVNSTGANALLEQMRTIGEMFLAGKGNTLSP